MPIRNTNAFPVSGTARLYEYLLPIAGPQRAGALAVSAPFASRLAAHHPRHKPHVLDRYPAPVDPWAQKSC